MSIIIFTDGSSRGNPGPGGWGTLVIVDGEKVYEIGGREKETTNNRMELTATLRALEFLEERDIVGDVTMYLDSAYVLQGASAWMYAWEKNNWRTSTKEEVANQDLWKQMLAVVFRLKQKRKIIFEKVKGHAGVGGNVRVDEIATVFADGGRPMLFTGSYDHYKNFFNFDAHDTAENIEAEPKSRKPKAKSSRPGYSYVSLVDGRVHVDKTWAACEKRVKGTKGAKYKKAMNAEEESELVALYSLQSL